MAALFYNTVRAKTVVASSLNISYRFYKKSNGRVTIEINDRRKAENSNYSELHNAPIT